MSNGGVDCLLYCMMCSCEEMRDKNKNNNNNNNNKKKKKQNFF